MLDLIAERLAKLASSVTVERQREDLSHGGLGVTAKGLGSRVEATIGEGKSNGKE